MSPGPSRRFGGQPRIANSNNGKKKSRSKAAVTQSGAISNYLLDQGPFGLGPHDAAARPLTPQDLSLAPFQMGDEDESTMGCDESTISLGALAYQNVDEDTLDDVECMPTRAQWKTIVDAYLASLHPTKRHKSLISQEVYKMIFRTLKAPEATRLGTPQFRFWARKMFQLVEAPNDILVVTNGGRPVAIKEHIYDILCMCHSECGHGGRDKTCKVLREYYTWVPKELISSFVKVCPTCAPRKLVAPKTKDRRAEETFARLKEGLPGPRFSVERLQDFGHFPSSHHESRYLKLPPVSHSTYTSIPQHQNANAIVECDNSEKSFIQASSRKLMPYGPFPPPWISDSGVTLPPLNSGVEHHEVKLSNVASDGNRQLSLPPLMQYLSQSYILKDKSHYPTENDIMPPTPASEIPIDPALLDAPSRSNGSRCACMDPTCSGCEATSDEYVGNALHLQLHPPAPLPSFHNDQHSEHPSSMELDTRSVTWEFPSLASIFSGEGDSSALLSASSVSTDLPTPSPSDQISLVGSGYDDSFHCLSSKRQAGPTFDNAHYNHGVEMEHCGNGATTLSRATSPPLFSPRPLRLENASAVLKLTAAASMDETND